MVSSHHITSTEQTESCIRAKNKINYLYRSPFIGGSFLFLFFYFFICILLIGYKIKDVLYLTTD